MFDIVDEAGGTATIYCDGIKVARITSKLDSDGFMRRLAFTVQPYRFEYALRPDLSRASTDVTVGNAVSDWNSGSTSNGAKLLEWEQTARDIIAGYPLLDDIAMVRLHGLDGA